MTSSGAKGDAEPDQQGTVSDPPALGALAKDTAKDAVGVVMGYVGGRVWLRPLLGGREWEVRSERVRSLTSREELSARLSARNESQRWGK
ncbi:hypothetical protein ABZW18_29800 [Streptomyces sp. NPDC004647]|uniref:hypothetical protein n=1 Tax=Streptomyces sp. NPDC004647 TaxID=3154671 RepID=UPI0033AFFE04